MRAGRDRRAVAAARVLARAARRRAWRCRSCSRGRRRRGYRSVAAVRRRAAGRSCVVVRPTAASAIGARGRAPDSPPPPLARPGLDSCSPPAPRAVRRGWPQASSACAGSAGRAQPHRAGGEYDDLAARIRAARRDPLRAADRPAGDLRSVPADRAAARLVSRRSPPRVRRAVLAHELWHVRRRDWGWVLAEECVRAVLWFNPAVSWLVSRSRPRARKSSTS